MYKVKLQTKAIFNIPFHKYDNDFTFVINGKRVKTNRIVADILSPKIAQMHLNDPTFDEFSIKTQRTGNPSYLLKLINFEYNEIPKSEASFLSEVIDFLGNDSIKVYEENKDTKISLNNVFDKIQKHDHFPNYYSKNLKDEIDFISEHFYEIKENHEAFQKLSLSTLQRIFGNPSLQLYSEDQLINCINLIYTKNTEYSMLYEFVEFENVSTSNINKFIQLFNINDITKETWASLSRRLSQQVFQNNDKSNSSKRQERYYTNGGLFIPFNENTLFKGIFNYIKENSNEKLEKEINITSSSTFSKSYDPYNIVAFDDKNKRFLSEDIENSWICIDFKKHKVIPTNYSIKSFELNQNSAHPKSWVVEASNDNKNWYLIDERSNCTYLNGRSFIHTFEVNGQNQNKYRYIRLRQTSPNWAESNYLMISCLEFYGIVF